MFRSKGKQVAMAVIAVGITGYIGVKYYLAGEVEKKVSRAVGSVSDYVDIEYGDVSVGLLSRAVHIEDIVVLQPGGGEIKIDDVVIHEIDDRHNAPHFARVALKGVELEVTPANFGLASEVLRSMGYEELELSMEVDYNYRKKGGDLNVTQQIEVDDMGSYSASLKLAGIDLDDNLQPDMMTLQRIKVSDSKVAYEDDSFIERLIEYGAEEKGVDADDIVDEIRMGLKQTIEAAKRKDSEFVVESLEQLSEFIEDPDAIEITMTPKKPLSYQEIILLGMRRDETALIKALNLRVRAK